MAFDRAFDADGFDLESGYGALLAAAAPAFVVLVELQPMEPLRVWTAAGGGLTNTYYCSFATQVATDVVPGGIYRRLDEVRLNATALTAQSSAAAVDANAGSYYHDVAAGRIYIRPTSANPPDAYSLIGVWFTLLLSTSAIDFDDQPVYAPLVTGQLPSITATMPDPLLGAVQADTGAVSLLNTDGLFDRLSRAWVWRNKRVTFKLGGADLAYADFSTIATMRINGIHPGDEVAVLELEDLGSVLNQQIPFRTFGDGTITPGAVTEAGALGRHQPIFFGTLEDCPLVLGSRASGDRWYAYDTTSHGTFYGVFDAIIAVERATQARTTLAAGFDYTTSAGTVTIINPTYYYETHDILANMHGTGVDATFGSLAQYLLELCGEDAANIDAAAFTAADTAAPQVLARYIGAPVLAADLLRELEQSVLGQVYRGADGRWTCRVFDPSLPADAPRALADEDMVIWEPVNELRTVLNEVRVRYAHKPLADEWTEVSASDETVRYSNETRDAHRLETWLTTEGDATALAQHLRFLRSTPPTTIRFEERGLTLMDAAIGDLVQVTRSRAPVARTGAYQTHLLRLVEIEKSLGPDAPVVRGVLNDLDGQTDHVARCLEADEDLDWSAATDEARAIYGFCGDADRYIDPTDALTRDAKVVW